MFSQQGIFILFSIIVGIAILIFSDTENTESPKDNPISDKQTEAFINSPAITQFDKHGLPTHLKSKQAQLFANGMIDIASPHITLEGKNDTYFTVTANQGSLNSELEQLALNGNVVVTQRKNKDIKAVIRSEELMIDNLSQSLSSETHVSMTVDNIKLEAVGLSANYKNSEIQLKSKVRGSYETP